MQVVTYDEAALRAVARHVVTLAEVEDLPAHGEAVTVRFSRQQYARDRSEGRA
jgi:histidinol dehydrogenase